MPISLSIARGSRMVATTSFGNGSLTAGRLSSGHLTSVHAAQCFLPLCLFRTGHTRSRPICEDRAGGRLSGLQVCVFSSRVYALSIHSPRAALIVSHGQLIVW